MADEAINYQCNVETNEISLPNFGCGKVFGSRSPLAPKDRLCPKCRGTDKRQDPPPSENDASSE